MLSGQKPKAEFKISDGLLNLGLNSSIYDPVHLSYFISLLTVSVPFILPFFFPQILFFRTPKCSCREHSKFSSYDRVKKH